MGRRGFEKIRAALMVFFSESTVKQGRVRLEGMVHGFRTT